MMTKQMLAVAAALAALAACGRSGQQANKGAPSGETQLTPAAAQIYSGSGTVEKITGDQVTIKHGPIAGIGWPAMTMTFTAPGDLAKRGASGNGSGLQLSAERQRV